MFSINCRDIVKDAESRIARAAEERDEELAEKVRKATFEQLHSKFNSDLEILKKRIPTRDPGQLPRRPKMSSTFVNGKRVSAIKGVCFSCLVLDLF